MSNWRIDCKDILTWCKEYNGPKFHAMLCDPPYELGFMGKDWDKSGIAFDPEVWIALKEHLLPGAFIFVFGSSRGWHRLAVAIEDAGFVFHPSLMMWGWVQGQGFCKATNIHSQLEKQLCYQDGDRDWLYRYDNEPIKVKPPFRHPVADRVYGHRYGRQALRPLVEMIICAQKPYEGKPFECIAETGAGALWIDGARVALNGEKLSSERLLATVGTYEQKGWKCTSPTVLPDDGFKKGRWPSNFCLVHTPDCQKVGTRCVSGGRCNTSGVSKGRLWSDDGGWINRIPGGYTDKDGLETIDNWDCAGECAAHRLGEGKDVARFFPQFDWNAEVTERLMNSDQVNYCAKAHKGERTAGVESNLHPTVKPIALAKWLATLLLPPSEYAPRRLLIPFAGVMSEAIGAKLAGWEEIVGIEMEKEYCEIGEARMKFWSQFESREDGLKAAKVIKKQNKQHVKTSRVPLKLF